MTIDDVQHVSISIQRPFDQVYEFVSDPRNLPQWAAGLVGATIERRGDLWCAESPMGPVSIAFTENNPYGVCDHDVMIEPGLRFHNPLRVLLYGERSIVVFTLLRAPGASDEELARDRAMIEGDLAQLQAILEMS